MKRKGILIILVIAILILVGTFLYNGFSGNSKTKSKNDVLPNTNIQTNQNSSNSNDSSQSEDSNNQVTDKGKITTFKNGTEVESDKVTKTKKLDNYYLDGTKEKAEKKKADYSYLLEQEPIPFEPKIPNEWTKTKMQIDEIPNYASMPVEERVKKLVKKTDFNNEQNAEWNKIYQLNSVMDNAFQKGDYNTYLSYMYKSWREFNGISIGNIIKTGDYTEKTVDFFPEIMDLKIGYAYGFYVKETTYSEKGTLKAKQLVDGFVMYKQNDKGDWEVYFDRPNDQNN